jgi:hypothetical protein
LKIQDLNEIPEIQFQYVLHIQLKILQCDNLQLVGKKTDVNELAKKIRSKKSSFTLRSSSKFKVMDLLLLTPLIEISARTGLGIPTGYPAIKTLSRGAMEMDDLPTGTKVKIP